MAKLAGKRVNQYIPELILRSRVNTIGIGSYILELVLTSFDDGQTKLQLIISEYNVYCFSLDLAPYSLELFDEEDYLSLATLSEIHEMSYAIGEDRILDVFKSILTSCKSENSNGPKHTRTQMYHYRRIFHNLCTLGIT
jgi:hypothetical protein